MPRRRKTNLIEDLITIGTKLPWWAGFSLALISYIGFHLLAEITPPKLDIQSPDTLGSSVFLGMMRTISGVLQYLVPLALTLGAVVSVFARTKRTSLLKSATDDADSISKMSWKEFEILISEAFRQRGYSVEERGGRGADGGVDSVFVKDGKRYLAQCKHWRSGRVPVATIRELLGVITSEKAAGGFVFASKDFTRDAVEFAKGNNISLVDGKALRKLIELGRDARDNQLAINGEDIVEAKPINDICPKCGAPMIDRLAKKGPNAGQRFLGCTRFPACRMTKSL